MYAAVRGLSSCLKIQGPGGWSNGTTLDSECCRVLFQRVENSCSGRSSHHSRKGVVSSGLQASYLVCARARACVYDMGKWLKNGLLSMICFFSILLLGRYNKACKMAAIGWHVAHRHFIWLAEDLTFLGGGLVPS